MIAPKGFEVGATIEYGCDEGHLLVGPSKRLCMDTGFYNEFPPVCKCKFQYFTISLIERERGKKAIIEKSIPINTFFFR